MTQQEIIEGNKLIAEFMELGWKPIRAGYSCSGWVSKDIVFKTQEECLKYCDELNEPRLHDSECFFPLPNTGRYPFVWDFEKNWNALKSVVDKIFTYSLAYPEQVKWVSECKIVVGIIPCYQKCVEFIQWFNNQRQQP